MGAEQPFLEPQATFAFSEEARQAVYDVIALRRDVRHFRSGVEVAADVLERILGAAHQGPSVGLSQPWGFVVVRDVAVRERIRESFLRCREAEAARYPGERRASYLAHKLEGILEASVNVCVAVDLRSQGEAILGTTVQPEAVRASACCAVENLWLAARAEGIGVGWVSIVEPAVLRAELSLPPGVEPIAYLCIGHPIAFRENPMLEETGWRSRRPLREAVHLNGTWVDTERPSAHPCVSSPNLHRETPKALGDIAARAAAVEHQSLLTKPIGSLGRLEDIAVWYSDVRGTFPPPAVRRAVLAIFAADHGVTAEGVSAYGSNVTSSMVANVMAGGAAVNAMATTVGVDIVLVDVGVSGDLTAAPIAPRVPLQSRRVRAGTANLMREPSMSRMEAEAAIAAGAAVARTVVEEGADVVLLGEIGIGNTTAASALICHLTGETASRVVGRGTGIDDKVWARKVRVVEQALALHEHAVRDPIDALASFGGLEIAALAGCALAASRFGVPVVLDGLVTNAAALVAVALDAAVRRSLLASHRSPEPGASVALQHLGLGPLLDLGLRLGEGTGAVLAASLLRVAVATQLSMATFATAGIVGRPGTELHCSR